MQTEKKQDWINNLTHLLDNSVRVPGTNYKFGIDPIIGIIPVYGDIITFIISSVLVVGMARKGVSGKIIIMMVGNILFDTVVGAVPILGDLFDFQFKANKRNLKLLKKHQEEGKHQGSGLWIIVLLVLVLIIIGVMVFYLLWKLIEFMVGLLY